MPSLGSPLCPTAQPSLTASPQTEDLFDLIASSQSRRLDDQRASVGSLPGLRITHNNLGHLRSDGDPQEPGDEFFNMLIKCQVGCREGGVPRPQARRRPRWQGLPASSWVGGRGAASRLHRCQLPSAHGWSDLGPFSRDPEKVA